MAKLSAYASYLVSGSTASQNHRHLFSRLAFFLPPRSPLSRDEAGSAFSSLTRLPRGHRSRNPLFHRSGCRCNSSAFLLIFSFCDPARAATISTRMSGSYRFPLSLTGIGTPLSSPRLCPRSPSQNGLQDVIYGFVYQVEAAFTRCT